jgi:hypothetical protein
MTKPKNKPTKVFMLINETWGDTLILGVFSTREKAYEYAKTWDDFYILPQETIDKIEAEVAKSYLASQNLTSESQLNEDQHSDLYTMQHIATIKYHAEHRDELVESDDFEIREFDVDTPVL